MATADIKSSETSDDIQPNTGRRTWCIFQTKMNPLEPNYCRSMALLGSAPEVGSWDRVSPIVATYNEDRGIWRVHVELPVRQDIEYKWIIYNKLLGDIVSYETGNNRHIRVENQPLLIEDEENGIQSIREMRQEEVTNLIPHLMYDRSTDEIRDISAQNKSGKCIFSTSGAAKYDESLVQQGKHLEPRDYVPDVHRKTGELSSEASKEDLFVGNRLNDVEGTSVDDLRDNSGSKSNWKTMFSRNKNCILKVGLIAGVSVAAMVLYRRFFRK